MIAAIVLAAGASRRMGRENKLLLPFTDKPLIAHVVHTVLASEADEVVVVLGHEADRVQAALEGYDVRFVHNDRYPEGMTTSIHAGVQAASPEALGFMICLSDLPLIEPDDLNQLLAVFRQAVQEDEHCIVRPVFEGQRGNPVLFSAFYKLQILGHQGVMGCRGLVKQNRDRVIDVEMVTDHVVHDIDTPAAYAHLQALKTR